MIYSKIEQNRKSWQPVTPTIVEYATEGSEDTLSRCLSLRNLEIPVKSFLQDGLSRKESKAIGEEGILTLKRNMEDEERHELALNNCVRVSAFYDSEHEAEADFIRQEWENHPDFPITKAAVLENGIFFVVLPLYRQYGGEALRTTALDVSADESLHVRGHRYSCQLIGNTAKPSASLDKLRKDTIDWIITLFNVKGIDKNKFRLASDDLMYKGITNHLDFTRTSVQYAFFERNNGSLPYYN